MVNSIEAGFAGHPGSYNIGFAPAPPQFATPAPVNFGAPTYSGPLPVGPLSVNTYATTSHHTYSTASPVPVVKYHTGFNPFTAYAAGPSFTKFSAPSGHVSTVYGGPLPYESYGGWNAPTVGVNFAAPVAAGSGWNPSPRTVVKFGRPITTTTTTYSTGVGALAAPAQTYGIPPQSYAATPFAGPVGW